VVGPKDLPCALLLRLSAMHSTVTVEGTPRVITIDAKRGATRVAHARVQPKYEAYYPNGKGCDPKCLQAEARIATVAP
jgi:hypothetical protein